MSAYVEIRVKGGTRAVVEAGSIIGVMAPTGGDTFTIASEKTPAVIVIRGGETFEMIEESAGKLLYRCAFTRIRFKTEDDPRTGEPYIMLIDFLQPAPVDDTAQP